MERPWKTWLVFACCLAVCVAAMSWLSVLLIRLDHAQREGQVAAAFEEKVRLALWRIDSAMAPFIAEESARPYFTYRPFYPAERAYNRMFLELGPGEVLVPSPLLNGTTNVLLHFQLGPDGELTSPQIPAGRLRPLAARANVSPARIQTAQERLDVLHKFVRPEMLALHCAPGRTPVPTLAMALANSQLPQPQQQGKISYANAAQAQQIQQQAMNAAELQARAQVYQQTLDNALQPSPPGISEGPLRPFWFGSHLVLARRVIVDGADYFQGCWIDWPQLSRSMLDSIRDLLPQARFEPAPEISGNELDRRLASLPARLIPGPPGGDASALVASPIRAVLATAWVCLALAAFAIGALLSGALALSERRAAFVSAVTHELRTPLTTFKMYAEMLAADMVTDPEKRRHYLNTLCSEANRLGHLVENVLAYARLERGSARTRIERLKIGDLIERVRPRLADRAVQAGMTLAVDAEPHALQTVVSVDPSAVEQILFNLVDNACKYAARAPERLIHLEAFPHDRWAMLRVRDHGEGISPERARHLFRPFNKSATEAAHSAPGVGLGLALCRRLSRGMGGDLLFEPNVTTGACFVLRLPLPVSCS